MTDGSLIDIEPDAIDANFVPEARADVASLAIGNEIVLGRIVDGTPYLQTCALNESGSILWQCFDGSGTIAEIAADIADVFGADISAVTADVEGLARQVGGAGFLVGVHEPALEVGDPSDSAPTGIAIGLPFPDFEARTESGERFSVEQLRGRAALLVSWSPTCSFCELIGDDLAALSPSLADAGVDIVFFATGSATESRDSLDRHRLTGRLLLQPGEIADAFVDLGTPVAYLLDEQSHVAAPLALGSTEVVDLARSATRDAGRR